MSVNAPFPFFSYLSENFITYVHFLIIIYLLGSLSEFLLVTPIVTVFFQVICKRTFSNTSLHYMLSLNSGLIAMPSLYPYLLSI